MSLFNPIIGGINAKTLQGSEASEFVKETEASGIVTDVLDVPVATSAKQVPYIFKTNKIANGDFVTDVTGWTAAAYGGASNASMVIDPVNYNTAANGAHLTVDIPADAEQTNRGVSISQTVDLTGVETITLYAKQVSIQTVPEEALVPVVISPVYASFVLEGTNVMCLDTVWGKYVANIPEAYRLSGQTLTIGFQNQSTLAFSGTEVILDDIVGLGTPENLFNYIADLDSYIASLVTFDNLNTNGDVGTGSDQVPAGDHSHGSITWGGDQASDPASPVDGYLYWNTTTPALRLFINNTVGWKTIPTS